MKTKYCIVQLLIILFFLPSCMWAVSPTLSDIRLTKNNSMVEAEFVITQPTQYRVFTLSNPDRFILDLTNTRLTTSLADFSKKITAIQPDIKIVRGGQFNPTTFRIVFDLNHRVKINVSSNTQKITLSIPRKNILSSQPVLITQKISAKPFMVVIDPGHGGKDPGTTGTYGTKEKNVVLAISKKLADLINRDPHTRAVLTRDHDYFVPLRTRMKLAHKGKADLFIAIHADASPDNNSEGASVYALSQTGATKEARHLLNNNGNYFELSGVDMNALEDKSSSLRSVLIDLAQTATLTDSMHLGTDILNSLNTVTTLHYRHVVQAPFMVLKSPDIPSILIETCYLSNPREEQKMRDPNYQNKIAQAIFHGISQYLKKYSTATV